jgi:uncharacterized membrane protein YbhN (UPF0104 family)
MELRRLARLALPWVGSAVLLSYMAHTTDLDSIWASLQSISLPWYLTIALLATLFTFFTDALGVRRAMASVAPNLPFRDTLTAKATSYLLNILNYNAALAGMALFFKRSRNLSFWHSLGALFAMNLADALVLFLVLGLGLALNWNGPHLTPHFQTMLLLLSLGGVGGFVLGLLLLRGGLSIWPLTALRQRSIIKPLLHTSALEWVRMVGLRSVLLGQYLLIQFCFLGLFNIKVPLLMLVVFVPVTTLIQIIPVSIGGLGTTQLAMREFYAPFVATPGLPPEAVVDAYSTAAIFGFIIYRLLLAWAFMGQLSRQVLRDSNSKDGTQVTE